MAVKSGSFLRYAKELCMIIGGCACFGLGFDLFLAPNAINVGGLTGLAMVIQKVIGMGSIALISALLNVPLFLLGYHKLGKKFFFGSLIGTAASSLFLELFNLLPPLETEPLLAALYGGAMSGFGLGLVFMAGASTGGSDIITRLLKHRFRELKLGRVMMCLDLAIVALTGLVFWDISKALYSAVTLFACSTALDAVLYGAHNSGVAFIISDKHEAIAQAIGKKLERGVTLLPGTGYYSQQEKTVLLCAVSKKQIGQLKLIVSSVDPDAFVILQEAHQVLGEGFQRYNDSL